MTITPTSIATGGFSNFNDALYQLLKPLEGDIPFVYADQKGIPTLGIGYALVVKNKFGVWELSSTYPADLSAAGINLTLDLNTNLTTAMNALNGEIDPLTNKTYVNPFHLAADKINPLGWTMGAQGQALHLTLTPPLSMIVASRATSGGNHGQTAQPGRVGTSCPRGMNVD